MDNQPDHLRLTRLSKPVKDGEMGFRTCAEHIDDSEIKGMLMERARHCAESASELQNEVRRLGGDPDTHSSISGSLHRGWLNVKAVITGKDESCAGRMRAWRGFAP